MSFNFQSWTFTLEHLMVREKSPQMKSESETFVQAKVASQHKKNQLDNVSVVTLFHFKGCFNNLSKFSCCFFVIEKKEPSLN